MSENILSVLNILRIHIQALLAQQAEQGPKLIRLNSDRIQMFSESQV